ncbi:hypothetical protein Pcinc_004405 [Petrolisthes cinctipes]|uniref:Uncharacterized protein n=1 Tax=Petrolisthes cinctipes TaxID=88211 RepID=A0AAE1GFR7_PETCI|nr:hypothetical protein Pcinc_004405 [Petrolisthes cinctipes]
MQTRIKGKRGVAEVNLKEISRVSSRVKGKTSVSTVPQVVEPASSVPVRRTRMAARTATNLQPPTENSPNEAESTSNSASPILVQKILPLRGGRVSRQVVSDSAELDKENKNAVRGKQNKQRKVVAPLNERRNQVVVVQEKENKNICQKRNEAIDNENTFPTPTTPVTQPPTRRSNRNKNLNAPKLLQASSDQKSMRNKTNKASLKKSQDRKEPDGKEVSKKGNEVCQLEEVLSLAQPSTMSVGKRDARKKAPVLKEIRVIIPKIDDQSANAAVRCSGRKRGQTATCKRAALNKNDKTKSNQEQNVSTNEGDGKSQPAVRLRGNFAVPKNPSPIHSGKLKRGRTLNTLKNSPSQVPQRKTKAPVWAGLKPLPTPGKRHSMRLGQSAYEFPDSPSKEGVKKRVVRKRYPKKQKKFKSLSKMTLLTTDPDFMQQFQRVQCSSDSRQGCSTADISSISSIRGLNEFTQDTGASIMDEEEFSADSIPSDDENIFEGFEGETVRSYIQPDENIFEGFEGETASSFVQPKPQLAKSSMPMTSITALPTPALSKHISKYIGGSSTPRVDNPNTNQELSTIQDPISVNDDIALCFGFESESDSELGELTLSPVRRSGLQHSLEVTGTSDVDCHSTTQVSRYCLGTVRQSNKNNVSVTRPVLGQKKSSMADVLTKSKLQKSLLERSVRKRGTLEKENSKPKCYTGRTRNKLQRTTIPIANITENTSCEEADTSVLFDDEEVLENFKSSSIAQNSQCTQSFLSPANGQATRKPVCPSPEKTFVKAPRKSYNRAELQEIRKTYIKACGGYATTETETETESDQEELPKKLPVKRAKVKAKAPSKKRKKAHSKNSTNKDTASKGMKHRKKTKEDIALEKSASDWASNLNNHFSEVEETFLTCE